MEPRAGAAGENDAFHLTSLLSRRRGERRDDFFQGCAPGGRLYGECPTDLQRIEHGVKRPARGCRIIGGRNPFNRRMKAGRFENFVRTQAPGT